MKKNYLKGIADLFSRIQVTSKNQDLSLEKSISEIVRLIIQCKEKGNKIMFIGNGGSASFASHITTDFLKNAHIPAMAFNDASLITCLSNDLGYEYVFEKPLGLLANKGDILFVISSSGKSLNILRAVTEARSRGCVILTLSGFDRKNPLRKQGEFNFYVPSSSYGEVEIVHLSLCHYIVDSVIENLKHG